MAQADDFRIEPDDLLAVARQVENILGDISGYNGNVAGNQEEFKAGSQPSHLQSALASVFPEISLGSPFVSAFTYESEGLNAKYDGIVDQLQKLATACRTTAEAYGAADANTQAAVNQMDGAMGGAGAPSGKNGVL